MAVPEIIFQNIEVKWVIPSGVTSALYDTVNVYSSSDETQGYVLLVSLSFLDGSNPRTSYVDLTKHISTKNTSHYTIIFSHSVSGILSDSYLAYKALTPREQRIVFQLRDGLSRFITNRLADEEVRQYIDLGINGFNIYPPVTQFTIFSLPISMEPLVITGSLIMGVGFNLLGIGFTDITYNDNGFALTSSRADKMAVTFDKVLGMYNGLLGIAKMDFAPGPIGLGTVALPVSIGGNLNRGMLNVMDLLNSMGR